VAGRIPIVAVGVPACGVKGRLARLLHRKRARTKRSVGVRGSTGVGFAAGVRGREAVGRWNWDERSRQRDRREGGGATGALPARGRSNRQGVFDGAKRERVGRPEVVGLREAYRIARSGGMVELRGGLGWLRRGRGRGAVGWSNIWRRKPQVPGTPVAKHRGWRGLRRSCAGARAAWLRPRQRVAGELVRM
jgi:hypothetical protein